MVSSTLIGNLPLSLLNVVTYNIQRAIKGDTQQYLYSLDTYLEVDKESREYYEQRGREHLSQIIRDNPKWKVTDELFNDLPSQYFCYMGALHENVMIGFAMLKDGFPRALYTRSERVLRQLELEGRLVVGTDIDKVLKSVYGTKTKNGLSEGKIGVIRLDLVEVVDGIGRYKLVVPSSPLALGSGGEYLIFPLKCMQVLVGELDSILRNNIVQFTETVHPKGYKRGSITLNADKVAEVYSDVPKKELDSKLSLQKVGYDYNALRYFCYDLESSVYSRGYATFRPDMLDRFKIIGKSEIDKSRHNINPIYLRMLYKDTILKMDVDDILSVTFKDLSDSVTFEDKRKGLIRHGEELSSKDLYELLKSNESLFGNLEEGLRREESKCPNYIKDLESFSIPKNPDTVLDILKELVNRGVVKVTYETKKGKVNSSYISNHRKVLGQMLGATYVRDFESVRYRLTEVSKLLSTVAEGGKFSKANLESLIMEYGLTDVLPIGEFIVESDNNATQINLINDKLVDLSQKHKAKNISKTALAGRNIFASRADNFYMSVDSKAIKQIEFCDYTV